MNLSPASKSETGCSRVLFLSMDRLAVYHCPDRKSVWPFLFDNTAEGMRYFDSYLRDTPGINTFLLVDMVQEEFRQDVIPHVSGPDRRAIFMRKKQQFFKDTPYFHAELQGRENEGRRDDIVLYTALTNPAFVLPWMKLLMDNMVPLAGISSLPHLTRLLLDHLPGTTQQRLVVSLQSISGLRLTFFLNDKLKMSRLIDLPFCRTEYCIERIHDEVDVMIRYLNTMHLVDKDNPLSVCILTGAPVINELQKVITDSHGLRHHFVDVRVLAGQLGLHDRITALFCDQLLVYLLLTRKMSNYYATQEELRYYRWRNAGKIMHLVGTSIICTTLFWSGLNYIAGNAYERGSANVAKKAEYFDVLDRFARKQMPQMKITPVDLKRLSDISNELEQQRVEPFDMLQMISTVMNQFPMLQLEQINWNSNAEPVVNVDDAVEKQTIETTTATVPEINRIQRFQTATLNGYIQAFDGDYRKALEMIGEFSAALKNLSQVKDVSILTPPLDIGPEASLEGNSVTIPHNARFSIKIVMELHIET